MTGLPDTDVVAQLVMDAAREEILPRAGTGERRKPDGSVVTEADLAVQARLARELQSRWPDIPLLGEEMSEAEQQRLLGTAGAALWVLDPLDGTSNFAAGIPMYAVSLALVCNGEIRLGVVYDPERHECFTASRGGGAFLNGAPMKRPADAPSLARSIAIIDMKRLPATLARKLAERPPFRSQRNFGSVALEWCWLAAGRGQVYLHGKQKMWDYAAGSLVCREAGGHAMTLEGREFFTLPLGTHSVAAALRPELFDAWRRWLEIP